MDPIRPAADAHAPALQPGLYALSRAVEAQSAITAYAQSGGVVFRPAQVGAQTLRRVPNRRRQPCGLRTPRPSAGWRWQASCSACWHSPTRWRSGWWVGAAIFCAFHFQRRALAVTILLALFAVMYTPWLLRTYRVSGNPFGVAGYSLFDGSQWHGGADAQFRRTANRGHCALFLPAETPVGPHDAVPAAFG